MNKIKLFIIIICLLILCGCNSSYNLTIDDDIFSEEINLDISNLSNNITDNSFYPFHNNFDVLYDKNIYSENNYTFLNLKYNFTPSNFINSTAYSDCFLDRKFENNDDYYYFKMYKMIECYYGEDYDINIKTNNKVLYNNADSVKNNVYTWHVNSNNKDDLLIEIKISKYKSNNDKVHNYLLIGIAIVVIVIAIFFFELYNKKKKSRNEI